MEKTPEAAAPATEAHFHEERWKKLPQPYQDYEISDIGRFRSLIKHSNVLVKPTFGWSNGQGYRQVAIFQNGKRRFFYVHRLVAEAFIPKTFGKNFVNHINGDGNDNRVENLEWVTREENERHKQEFLNPSHDSSKKQIVCVETGKIFDCMKDAAREYNVCYRSIRKAISGVLLTAGGYHWQRKEN